MKIILLLSLLVGLVGCNSSTNGTTESSGGRSPGSVDSSLPIRWSDSSLPLSVKVSDDFTFGDDQDLIEDMLKEWDDKVTGKVLFNYSQSRLNSKGTDALSTYRDGILGIYLSDGWFSDVSSDALAITQFYATKVSASSGEYYELVHADIIANNKDHNFSFNAGSTSDYDMSTVILHELGHLLGLTHQTDSSINAVMQPYLSKIQSKRTLSSDDSQRISANYTDSALTSGSGLVYGASYQPSGIPDGEELHGIIELMASGECRHIYNGKLIYSHFSY